MVFSLAVLKEFFKSTHSLSADLLVSEMTVHAESFFDIIGLE